MFSLDLDPSLLVRVLSSLPGALDGRREPMRSAFSRASAEVMRFENHRFRSASGGDGQWKPLARVTKAKRLEREIKESRSKRMLTAALLDSAVMPILSVTGTLENALFDRGSQGHFVAFDADGVSEGVAGGTHPHAPMSVGELATIHHYGSGRIPARPVMGPVDQPTEAVCVGMIAAGVNDAFDVLAAAVGGTQSAAE